jgi:hypothetical protein
VLRIQAKAYTKLEDSWCKYCTVWRYTISSKNTKVAFLTHVFLYVSYNMQCVCVRVCVCVCVCHPYISHLLTNNTLNFVKCINWQINVCTKIVSHFVSTVTV